VKVYFASVVAHHKLLAECLRLPYLLMSYFDFTQKKGSGPDCIDRMNKCKGAILDSGLFALMWGAASDSKE